MYGVPSFALSIENDNDSITNTTIATNTTTEDAAVNASSSSWGNSGTNSSSSSSEVDIDTTTDFTTTVKYANYTSGNGSTEILFTYTVQAEDSTDRLDYAAPAAAALTAPFGSILAVGTLEPVYLRSLPEPGTEGSLGWNNDIRITSTVLFVERVSTIFRYFVACK